MAMRTTVGDGIVEALCNRQDTFAQTRGSSRASGVASSGDGLPVSDDPQVTRPSLQAIKRGFDVSRRRLTRPALADLLNLARGLQHMEPTERLVVVESGGLSDLPDRMRLARQLAKRRSQSILAWRRSRLGCSDLWLGDWCGGGPLSRWHGRGGAIARHAAHMTTGR
jgi:hypothetical protein